MEQTNDINDKLFKELFSSLPMMEPSADFTDRVMNGIGVSSEKVSLNVVDTPSKLIWYILMSISGFVAIILLYMQFPLSRWFSALTGGGEIEFGLLIYVHRMAQTMMDKVSAFEPNTLIFTVLFALLSLFLLDKLLKSRTSAGFFLA